MTKLTKECGACPLVLVCLSSEKLIIGAHTSITVVRCRECDRMKILADKEGSGYATLLVDKTPIHHCDRIFVYSTFVCSSCRGVKSIWET